MINRVTITVFKCVEWCFSFLRMSLNVEEIVYEEDEVGFLARIE